MEHTATRALLEWWALRRAGTHVAAFVGGVIGASLVVCLPAALLVAAAVAPPAALAAESARVVVKAGFFQLFAAAWAAVYTYAHLLDLLNKRRHAVGNRFDLAAAVGFVHGVFCICPLILLDHWYERRHGPLPPGAVIVTGTIALFWYAIWCFTSGVVVVRLV